MEDLFPNFSNQYNKTYRIRLNTLRPLIKHTDDCNLCDRIHDLNNYTKECMIIGILFISSDLKTTIFDNLNAIKNQHKLKEITYFSKDIKYFLEDETGKIELKMADKNEKFISTGMILGFKGIMKCNKFNVSEIIFPTKDIKLEKSSKNNIKVKSAIKDAKIAFVSGVEIRKNNKNKEHLKIISDYLLMKGITQIIIFGPFFDEDFDVFKKFIDSLNIEIKLIPELSDFGCLTYPLLPVHRNLFNKKIFSFHNPSLHDIYENTFIFSSQGIIKDLLKYLPQDIKNIQSNPEGYRMHLNESDISLEIDNKESYKNKIIKIISGILDSRLLCPSGPDTLSLIPYSDTELLFIDRPVDYFIVPNCTEVIFHKDWDTIVLGVPKFTDTHKIIILNLETKDYEVLEFEQ
jgi:DNA polymerase delta subunit 2